MRSPELIENGSIELRPTEMAAAGMLALAALALASIGWATYVIPSVRSISPEQIASATRAASFAPVLLALGGAHAVAAGLALSERRRARRLLSAFAVVGAAAALGVSAFALMASAPAEGIGGLRLSVASIAPAAMACWYAGLALVEHRAAAR